MANHAPEEQVDKATKTDDPYYVDGAVRVVVHSTGKKYAVPSDVTFHYTDPQTQRNRTLSLYDVHTKFVAADAATAPSMDKAVEKLISSDACFNLLMGAGIDALSKAIREDKCQEELETAFEKYLGSNKGQAALTAYMQTAAGKKAFTATLKKILAEDETILAPYVASFLDRKPAAEPTPTKTSQAVMQPRAAESSSKRPRPIELVDEGTPKAARHEPERKLVRSSCKIILDVEESDSTDPEAAEPEDKSVQEVEAGSNSEVATDESEDDPERQAVLIQQHVETKYKQRDNLCRFDLRDNQPMDEEEEIEFFLACLDEHRRFCRHPKKDVWLTAYVEHFKTNMLSELRKLAETTGNLNKRAMNLVSEITINSAPPDTKFVRECKTALTNLRQSHPRSGRRTP